MVKKGTAVKKTLIEQSKQQKGKSLVKTVILRQSLHLAKSTANYTSISNLANQCHNA
uniref:Uncharacterized protein n=1 Tax=Rhizophora mucronata TaxID=61149 RepID=A0A2P2NHC8_RHIMU